MERGVELWVIWNDSDMIEIEVVGWNGAFGGTTNTYSNPDVPGKAADTLEGFPKTTDDTREISFGGFLPKMNLGGVSLKFICADRAGHVLVDVHIEADNSGREGELVRFFMPVEPAAIDVFVDQLRMLQREIYGTRAFLAMAK